MKKSIITLSLILSMGLPAFSSQQTLLYDQVWKLINSKYVDQSNNHQNWYKWRKKYDSQIKTDEDAYVAIATMLASLNDPYTKFLNPKEFKEETNSIKGSLKGIGVQIGVKDGRLLIIAPMEGTPGEKAGLKAEDEILEIDGVSTKGITVDKAADKIRGEEGTIVKLLIKRKGEPNKVYAVQRAKIDIKSVSTKNPTNYKLDDRVGYIRLSSFMSQNAIEEFKTALNGYAGKKGYIIDLRSNPGGLFANAALLSDMFLSGNVIVSTVDRDGYKDTTKATKAYVCDKPLVILIDGGSASASEIFSGAMKDNGRALIVGEKSFGKGLVQEVNKLPMGAGCNITVQKYLTPSGTDINKKGIMPDVIVKYTAEDAKANRDPQLIKAESLLLKMITYTPNH